MAIRLSATSKVAGRNWHELLRMNLGFMALFGYVWSDYLQP
jgi:hypothetical protein